MILSFHPCIQADVNRLVAGRKPGRRDRELIRTAAAIILPQGVSEDLYELCREFCQHVFPFYDLRFQYPGKIGDALLFGAFHLPHPQTRIFRSISEFKAPPFPFPFLLKGNFSGEGRLVYKVEDQATLDKALRLLAGMERSGMPGFVAQPWIEHGGRDLRVLVLYRSSFTYWRVQNSPEEFRTNLSAGARIDTVTEPELQQMALALVEAFCHRSGINLAAFDVIFDRRQPSPSPLLLEINYYFGRRFFGSSTNYYRHLKQAVRDWLADIDATWPDRIK